MCELCCGGTREDQPARRETAAVQPDLTGKIVNPAEQTMTGKPPKTGIPAWMIIVSAVSVLIGAIICFAYSGGGTGTPPDKNMEITGGLMIGIPVFLWGAGIAAALLGFMIEEGKKLAAARKAMLARMTPQERQAYLLAETATLMAGAEILHHRMRETHKRVSARNTQTVLHGFGPTLAPPAPQAPQPPVSFPGPASGDPTDSSMDLLAQARRNREYLRTGNWPGPPAPW